MFLFKLQLFAHKTKKTAIRWGSAVCGKRNLLYSALKSGVDR